jgi:hypothetical protein
MKSSLRTQEAGAKASANGAAIKRKTNGSKRLPGPSDPKAGVAREERQHVNPHAINGEAVHDPVRVVEQIPIYFGDEVVTFFVNDLIF